MDLEADFDIQRPQTNQQHIMYNKKINVHCQND